MTETGAIDRAIRSVKDKLAGRGLLPGDAGYEDARRVWNGRFDRHPAAIVRCADVADVQTALEIARRNDLPVAVRSGGHDYAGHSVCDAGLVIDLSQLNEVAVDGRSRVVRVGPGARWGAIDRDTQALGLATTGGSVSTVGVTGYTLGGGSGHLSRKYGLALDNLLSSDVVTASGEIVRASPHEHADLFWGLRGGSGNFGIVTSLELRLHDLGPQVLAGQIIHPFERAPDVLRLYRSYMADAPDDLQCYAFFIRIPPLPAFPQAVHGRVAVDLVVTWAGAIAEGEKGLGALRAFGTPLLDTVAPMPYVALQQTFDAGMPAGNRWYSRAHYFRELSDATIDAILTHVENMPGEFTMVYLEAEGGAVGRVAPDATAFPHRGAAFALHIFPGWIRAADDEAMMEWARTLHRATSAGSTGGAYVNLLGGDEPDGSRSAYGSNYERLVEVKRKYDPDNLFRCNHNVRP